VRGAGLEIRVFVALGAAILFWASAFAGIRAGLEGYGPGHLALLRFLSAAVVLLGYAAVNRMRPPEARDLPIILLAGFLAFTVYHVALNYGETVVSAGAASVLINTAPIFTAVLSTVFLGERLRLLGWIGMAVSFCGVVIISASQGEGFRPVPEAFVILLAALSVSIYTVIQKPYLRKYGALNFTTYALLAGTLITLVFLPELFEEVRQAPVEATLAVVYLGIFPTAVAYVGFSYALSRRPASNTASFLFLVPALAFLIAWVWLGEVPAPGAVVGGAIVLLGVFVVNFRARIK